MSADQFLTIDGRPTVRVERALPAPDREGVAGRHDAGAPRPVVPEPGRDRPAAGRGDALRRLRRLRRATGTVEAVDAAAAARLHVGHRPADVRAPPDGDGTTFALTHTFDDRYGAASFATGWEMCLVGPAQRARRRAAAAARPWHRPPRGAGPRVRARPARGDRVRRPLDGARRAPADLPGRRRVGPVVRQGPRHRRAARGARGRRAADAVHGARRRDRHRDRGRAATECWRSTSPRTGGPGEHVRVELRRRHRSRRADHAHGHRHRSGRARRRRRDVGHRRHRPPRGDRPPSGRWPSRSGRADVSPSQGGRGVLRWLHGHHHPDRSRSSSSWSRRTTWPASSPTC